MAACRCVSHTSHTVKQSRDTASPVHVQSEPEFFYRKCDHKHFCSDVCFCDFVCLQYFLCFFVENVRGGRVCEKIHLTKAIHVFTISNFAHRFTSDFHSSSEVKLSKKSSFQQLHSDKEDNLINISTINVSAIRFAYSS